MKKALIKTLKTYQKSLPILVAILMIVNLINPLLSDYYTKIFSGNFFIDPLIGALAGSISFGIPLTSYIVGGELLNVGVSLLAIAAFIMAWTTVGVVMLPLEAAYLGKRFAIARNIVNFIFSLLIAILTIFTLKIWA